MRSSPLRLMLATIILACFARLPAQAGDTAFESLAFSADTNAGPQITLPEHPSLGWTRVAFRPQRPAAFPEELKITRTLVPPADQLTGLAVASDELWVASRATRQIYRLHSATAAVQAAFPSPAEQPAGLCLDGQALWHADAKSRSLFKLDRDGKVLQRLALPFEPGVVLRESTCLLVSERGKDVFHRLHPETGQNLGTERAPDDQLTGITRVGRYLWCSRRDEILCFDRERGLPVCGFSARPPSPAPCELSGLAAEGQKFWCVNVATNQILQFQMPRHGEWVGGGGRERQAGFEIAYRNTTTQSVDAFSVLQHVPFLEMPGQRYLTLSIQPEPRALFRDDLGNVVALLQFDSLPAGQSARCRISTSMWVADRRLVVDPDLVDARSLSPERRAYARNFHPIAGENSTEAKAFLEKAAGGETNSYWRVRKAHDALCQAIYYREPADESVPGILRQGYGVCRNYSAAMEAFGRLLGVPVLNAWAPRHETCFLLLPGLTPAVMEVTANDSGPDPASAWRRSRWFLGTSADEITTGVRGFAMHSPLLLDGTSYAYHWHYWLPAGLRGLRHEGWWTITNPATGKSRRL